jgi:hypothetical protein
MLVIAGKEKNAVRADGSSNRSAELVLTIAGLEIQERLLRTERTVPNKIKRRAMQVIGAGLGDDIDHRSPGPSELGPIGVGETRNSCTTSLENW